MTVQAAGSAGPADLWKASLLRVRERFTGLAHRPDRLKIVLIHWNGLSSPEDTTAIDMLGSHMTLVAHGPGPSDAMMQLFTQTEESGELAFVPVIAESPSLDIEGNPVTFSDGQPVAFRPNITRCYHLYFSGSLERWGDVCEDFHSTLTEAGSCLDGLPTEVKRFLWHDWIRGFERIPHQAMWIAALFELAWRKIPGSALLAERFAWRGAESVNVELLRRVQTQNSHRTKPEWSLPRIPCPPPYWYSVLDDPIAKSIAAIDALIMIGRGRAPHDAKVDRRSVENENANPNEDAGKGSKATGETKAPKNPKRTTQKGEAQAKLIAALTKHHKYADGSCLNLEPIGNNELARLAGVSESTASAFFNKQFGGHAKYRAGCSDTSKLVAALKLLNQEFAPHLLYGAKPPGEDKREDE